MESYVSFHLLHGLMNVAVQHGDRAKALEVGERLSAIFGAPAPLGVHGPEGNVSEYHDRRAGRDSFHIVLQPLQLLVPQGAESAGLEVQHVNQADEMDPLLIEAVPACPFGCLTV